MTRVNAGYKEHNDMKTLLTTQVENLHAMFHFKQETFSGLQYAPTSFPGLFSDPTLAEKSPGNEVEYAQDFGTIAKGSLKRVSKWAAKYYTHPSSYYPVPQGKVAR